MVARTHEQLILEGITGLPAEALTEILDFVYLVRKRILQPQEWEQDIQGLLLRTEIKQLSRDEQAHLEKEFEGYEQHYPRE